MVTYGCVVNANEELFAMEMQTLRDLYVDVLKDTYDAESQITEALPKMAEAASSSDLKKAFQMHLQQTEQHVKRLEQVFRGLGMEASGKKCKGMEGLIKEGQELIKEKADA